MGSGEAHRCAAAALEDYGSFDLSVRAKETPSKFAIYGFGQPTLTNQCRTVAICIGPQLVGHLL
jgi:hypothetical protein